MSTSGPNTAPGKAKVSKNAITHGIMSPAPVLPDLEDEDEWERHRLGIIDSLEPDNHLEMVLVERVANILWRLKRVERYENEITIVGLHRVPDMAVSQAVSIALIKRQETTDGPTEQDVDDWVRRSLLPDSDHLEKVKRYESDLHRQMIQTLHEIEALQTRRHGGATPLARFDVTRGPSDGQL